MVRVGDCRNGVHRRGVVVGGRSIELEIRCGQLGTVGHDQGALDDVLEFPDVAWPSMAMERGDRPSVEGTLAGDILVTTDQCAGERDDVTGRSRSGLICKGKMLRR